MSLTRSPRRVLRLVLPVFVIALVAAALPLAIGAVTLKLPKDVTKQQAYSMYAEQLDSQGAIEDLVKGKIDKFVVVDRSVSATSAELTLDVRYKNGLEHRGVMRLFKVGKSWYFKSISRGTVVEQAATTQSADIGVVNTILSEQTENQAVSEKFVTGTYRQAAIGSPRAGYRSVEFPVVFTGGKSVKKEAGRVTCISKTLDGEQVWFITGFSK